MAAGAPLRSFPDMALATSPGRLSPRGKARLAGVFEALEGAGSATGQVAILNQLVVTGDAAATAHNILANEFLYRIGFLLSIGGVVFHLAWVLLTYQLLKPLNRTLAQLAVFMAFICIAMQTVTSLLYLAPLLILKSGIDAGQAQSLAVVMLKINGAAFDIDLIFFGLWCVLTGYLYWRSTFLPRVLGLLLMLDGTGWALYVWPPLATVLFPAIAVASGAAEIPLQLWLIIFGFDNKRYEQQTRAHVIAP